MTPFLFVVTIWVSIHLISFLCDMEAIIRYDTYSKIILVNNIPASSFAYAWI